MAPLWVVLAQPCSSAALTSAQPRRSHPPLVIMFSCVAEKMCAFNQRPDVETSCFIAVSASWEGLMALKILCCIKAWQKAVL
jgi:hypothetical protein